MKRRLIRTGVTSALILAFAFMSIASGSSSSDSGNNISDNPGDESKQTEVSVDEGNASGSDNTDNSAEVDSSVLDKNKEAFEQGKYLFITGEDLQKFCSNMAGVKIYTVGKVSGFSDGAVQMNLSDKLMLSNFHCNTDYSSSVSDGDVVAIYGEVAGSDDYSLFGINFGTSVEVTNCEVFAVGSEAESYRQEKTDKGLSKYLVVTETVANNNEVTEKEYKSICKKLSYKKILRNPDDYKGKYAVVSGKVNQIIEGLFGTYTIYVVDKNKKKWECTYSYEEGESHILEGDKVKVYGVCDGTTTSTTLLGKQVTMPCIKVKYIN